MERMKIGSDEKVGVGVEGSGLVDNRVPKRPQKKQPREKKERKDKEMKKNERL